MQVTITHVEGSKAGQTETFDAQLVSVGRDPSNTLAFDPNTDIDVSSRHAQLVAQGEMLTVQDLGSRNGTFLNGQKVGNSPVPVAQGATIAFGERGPKVTVNYGPSGPGKKTRMISDMQGELEGAKKAIANEQSARSSGRMISCCVILFLLIGAGVGGFFLWKSTANKGFKKQVETAQGLVATMKSDAQKRNLTDFAKDEWAKADAAAAEGKTAETAGDWEKAAKAWETCLKATQDAQSKAGDESSQAQVAALRKAADEERAKRDADAEAERARLKKEEDDRNAKLKEGQGNTAATLDAAKGAKTSKNPDDVKNASAALEEQLKKDPGNAALLAELEALKKRLKELESFDGVAKGAAKAMAVIQSQSFFIPGGQREDTTQIREYVSEGTGTGTFITKDRILTAKEVVSPWMFDPKALAKATKLKEKGWQLITKLEVSQLDGGVFKVAFPADQKAATIAVQGPDVFGEEQKVTIPFDNDQVTVPVKPHKRDESAYAVIEVKGADCKAPLTLHDKPDSFKAADKTIMLGQQKAGPAMQGLKPGEIGLFQQSGELKAVGDVQSIGASSFSTWLGGPVLDAGTRVMGVIVEPGKETKAISVAKIKVQ